MVTHSRLQHYKKHHGLVCITGSLGCRWHRYQQSTHGSRKRDLGWFVFLVMIFCYIAIWLYLWLVGSNDSDKMNWFIYNKVGRWFHYYLVVVIMAGITCGYVTIIMVLALCHVGHGHQLYIHWSHKLMLLIIAVFCIICTVGVNLFWPEGWSLLRLSLLVIGPFLQIAAVILATFLTWIIAAQLFQIRSVVLKVLWFVIFVGAMLFLYVCPLLIKSPCIDKLSAIPPKPQLLAHRGAAALAPENTKAAFDLAHQYNASGIESDVLISYDGIPFIHHDKTFKRTTNIEELWPELADLPAAMFNISQIQELNAGQWFEKRDPFRIWSSLTQEKASLYRNQSIPRFSDLLDWVKDWGRDLLFDVKIEYMPSHHPFYNETFNITMKTIKDASIPDKNIWWLYYDNTTRLWGNYTMTQPVEEPMPSIEQMLHWGIFNLNSRYDRLNQEQIRRYQESNITANMYVINSQWLFSFFWCVGANSVTTDFCHVLSDMDRPNLYMDPLTYLIVLSCVDGISAIAVIIIFIVQRNRHSIESFNPEAISLQAARHRIAMQRHPNRHMKEKLIIPTSNSATDLEGIVYNRDLGMEHANGWSNGNIDGSMTPRSSTSTVTGSYQGPASPNLDTVDIDEVKVDMGRQS